MAKKRMYSTKITDSDAFIEMGSSAQALYFHLNQGADDDGFNNQVQIAMTKSHSSTDDLRVLMAKNFIIRFDNGVIVIKHWRMHNTLRKDRFTPTDYTEQLKCLGIKENGVYTLKSKNILENKAEIENGCQKVAIDKSSIDKNKETTTDTNNPPAKIPENIGNAEILNENDPKGIETPKTDKKSRKGKIQLPKEELELTNETKKDRVLTPQQIAYEYFREKYERRTGFKFCSAKSDFVILTGLCEQFGIDVVKQKIEFLEMAIVKNIEGTNLYWFAKDFTDFTIGKLKNKWNEIIPKLTKDQIDEMNRQNYFERKEKEKKGVV